MSQQYIRSLADPFDTSVDQPKLLDGRVDRSSGLRLRVTGDITCKTTGFTYIALINGSSNSICWQAEGSDDVTTATAYLNKGPPAYKNYIESAANQAFIRGARGISSGLKLALINGPEESDGMWESVRINSRIYELTGFLNTPSDDINNNTVSVTAAGMLAMCENMADNPTYQSGRLRDINRYMFRSNFRNAELGWSLNSTPSANSDTIIIRIRGRQVSGQPSILRFDTVQTAEVEYKPNTPMFRLMGQNQVLPDQDELLNKLNIRFPGIRIDG